MLQGDTLSPYLFIVCLVYTLQISADKMKELGFTLERSRNHRHPAKTIMDIDYTEDQALIRDTIDNATKLLHCTGTTVREICL